MRRRTRRSRGASRRRRWAQLIRRVYEIDPLVCPRCRGVIRVVSFIIEGRVIRRILDHLDASARRATQDRAPPPAAAAPSAFALGGGAAAVPPPRPFAPHRKPRSLAGANQTSYPYPFACSGRNRPVKMAEALRETNKAEARPKCGKTWA